MTLESSDIFFLFFTNLVYFKCVIDILIVLKILWTLLALIFILVFYIPTVPISTLFIYLFLVSSYFPAYVYVYMYRFNRRPFCRFSLVLFSFKFKITKISASRGGNGNSFETAEKSTGGGIKAKRFGAKLGTNGHQEL